ncbi:MAG: exodeoxyribonuclease V subunit gamma, partial [Deltaproteobacteria bacterium]|nr:exodeoxyribonuclease V subunit gamma [Deltaproteobacteria bacterium]
PTLRALLQKRVDARRARGGFMTGGVTFCQLRPFRPLPFRVVCVLGLDDGTFPRESRPLGFDRIGQDPEPWDRTPRRDDRQAFLETVLSTRERLLCSYVGRDIHRNKKLPPSVALAELLDALGDAHHCPAELQEDEDWARAYWVIRHPLQPFSYRYFDATREPELYSFEERHCAGATALAKPDKEPQVFLDHAVAAPPTAEEIELRDLIGYLQKPAQHFLRTALEVSLPEDPAPLADREPLTLDHLQEWSAGTQLLDRALKGVDLDELWEAIRAQGALPIGTPGQQNYRALRSTVEGLSRLAAHRRGGAVLPPRAVSLRVGDVVLTGSLGKLFPGGQVHAQYSKLARRSELGVWVEHLVLNALDGGARTHLVGREPQKGAPMAVLFDEQIADPHGLLEELVALYRLGRQAPLPFFPVNSRLYVEKLKDGDPPDAALRAIQSDWNKSCKRERENAHVELAFRGKEPLAPDFFAIEDEPRSTFARLSEWVYGPLLQHRQEDS